MPRGVKEPPPDPAPEHVHDLVTHCRRNDACPWMACRTCGFYGTVDGRRTAYRPGYDLPPKRRPA